MTLYGTSSNSRSINKNPSPVSRRGSGGLRTSFASFSGAGACFSKVPRTFRVPEASCQSATACFKRLIFYKVSNVGKIKRIAWFDGLESRRCEDVKGILALEIGPRSFETFGKQTPGPTLFVFIANLFFTSSWQKGFISHLFSDRVFFSSTAQMRFYFFSCLSFNLL